MSTAPHDDNNHDRNDQRASIEEVAARLRVPVRTIRYWRTHLMLRRAAQGRRPGSGSDGL
jgi:hypothetical protein